MSKSWIVCNILPQRAVLQTCYSRNICLGPTLLTKENPKIIWKIFLNEKIIERKHQLLFWHKIEKKHSSKVFGANKVNVAYLSSEARKWNWQQHKPPPSPPLSHTHPFPLIFDKALQPLSPFMTPLSPFYSQAMPLSLEIGDKLWMLLVRL